MRYQLHAGFLSLLFVSGTLWGQPAMCTQDTVVGTYALAYQGYIIMTPPGATAPIPVPGVGLELLAIDSQGTITGNVYQNFGGQGSNFPMPGKITVNADCTALVDWGGGVTGAIIVEQEGASMHSVMMSAGAMGKPIVHGQWKRISRIPNTIAPAQCSPADVSGMYVFKQQGITIVPVLGSPSPIPLALVGLASFGYDGAIAGEGTISMGGTPSDLGFSNGSVVANSDCSGTIKADVVSGSRDLGAMQASFIALEGGNELWSVQTQDPEGAPIMLGTWMRISPMPH